MVLSFERSLKSLIGLRCPANQELFSCFIHPAEIINLKFMHSSSTLIVIGKCLQSFRLKVTHLLFFTYSLTVLSLK